MNEICRCPACGKKVHTSLILHIDIWHNRRLTEQEVSALSKMNWKEVFEGAAISTPLKVSDKSAEFIGALGFCDRCQSLETRRWCYTKSNKGKLNLCWKCKDSLHKQNIDVFDSRKLLPGSFGG